MYIIPSEIEKYCLKWKYPIHLEVDIEDSEVVFRCVAGKVEMNSSLAIYLSGKEMLEILELNNITGEGGKIKSVLSNITQGADKKISDLIYDTLAKYILQMLHASLAEILFPELKPLRHHKDTYFRSHEVVES